jgi:hypothetical protein
LSWWKIYSCRLDKTFLREDNIYGTRGKELERRCDMHPIMTLKSWGHNDHMIQIHRLAEIAGKLFHDAAFWALVILITLFVAAFILALNTPPGLSPNYTPKYPFMY